MKVTILTENIEPYLPLINKALPTHTQVPILSNILLTAGKNGLILKATDLELGIEINIPAKIEAEGSTTVPGKEFLEVISTLPKDKITLELIKDTLVLQCRGSKVSFNTIAMEEFPGLYKKKGDVVAEFTKSEFVDIFSYLVFAVSTEETRPQLTGVFINKKDEKIDFVATDGYRMSVKTIEGGSKKDISQGLIISVKLISEVMGLKNDKSGILLRVNHAENQVFFEFGDVLFVGRMIEGGFPDYSRVIPKESKTTVVAEREDFLQNVKLASVFAKDQSNVVMLEIKDQVLSLSTRSAGVGEGEMTLDCEKKGSDTKIAFNARYLQELLRTVGSKNITMKLNSGLDSALFEIPESNFKHVIMPVQTDS